jgi:Na+/melibiose symporter-like transporter
MAVLMVATIMITVFGTARHIPYLKPPQTTRAFHFTDIYLDVMVSLKSKSFRVIFLGMLFFAVYSGVHSTMNLHMGTYFWELSPGEFTLYAMSVLVGAILGLPLAWLAIRIVDKKKAYLGLITISFSLITLPVVLRLLDWFPANDSPIFLPVYLILTLFGIACALAAGTAAASMVMDTTDEHEMNTGMRQEGAFYGAISFSGKAASAFGHLIGGIVIDLIRFPLGSDVKPGTVDPEIIWQLGFAFGPAVAILPLFTIWLVTRYEIDRDRHNEILVAISKRPAQA